MAEANPSPNGPQTGRDASGKFAKGNLGGPGNPAAAEVSKRRAQFLKAIRSSDITLAVKTLRQIMQKGKDSDRLTAARIFLERVLGPVEALDVAEEIKAAKEQIAKLLER